VIARRQPRGWSHQATSRSCIVRPPGGDTIALLNPRIVEQTGDTDEQCGGCLSFFDLRGKGAPAPATEVEHRDVDGRPRITVYERGVARPLAHELDQNGVLDRAGMREGVEPIPVSE
jgi:peptide deformylase